MWGKHSTIIDQSILEKYKTYKYNHVVRKHKKPIYTVHKVSFVSTQETNKFWFMVNIMWTIYRWRSTCFQSHHTYAHSVHKLFANSLVRKCVPGLITPFLLSLVRIIFVDKARLINRVWVNISSCLHIRVE